MIGFAFLSTKSSSTGKQGSLGGISPEEGPGPDVLISDDLLIDRRLAGAWKGGCRLRGEAAKWS